MGCLLSKPIEDNPLPLSNSVPCDIMVDILSRLPHKSLVRFWCVSRSWYNLRADVYFIHLNTNCRFKTQFFLLDKNQNLYSLVREKSDNQLVQIDRPTDMNCEKILGSCDGLLCVRGHAKWLSPETIYIWNTLTKECRKLPCPVENLDTDDISSFFQKEVYDDLKYRCTTVDYGFFYNPDSDDYEVVCMRPLCNRNSKVFVYSLRRDSWRTIGEIPWYAIGEPGAVVNGCLHWIAYSSDSGIKVIAYASQGDKFIEVELPHPSPIRPILVREFQGKLCLFPTDLTREHNFDIWVMNEYGVTESWTRLFTIPQPTASPRFVCKFLLCSTKEGLVVMRGSDDNIILHDALSGHRQQIQGPPQLAQVINNSMERGVKHNTCSL